MEINAKAYKEVWEILKFIPPEEYKKISPQILDIIESKMDENYIYEVKHTKDFENQQMLDETKILLAIFYIEYWASTDEKNKIIESMKLEDNKKLKKYFEKFFESSKLEEELVNKYMIIHKEKKITQIFKKIKKILIGEK